MANGMLSISVSSCNTIPQIFATNDAMLLNNIASSFNDNHSPELGVIVGLGFTAVLAEGSEIDLCSSYVDMYLCYRNFYYNDNVDALSHAITQIIIISMKAFKKLGHPPYYRDFIWAIYRVISTEYGIPNAIKQAIEKIVR